MSRSTLHFIRFFAPAVIFLVLSYGTAKMLKLTTADVPVSVNDLGYNLSYLIVATIYQYLPLRKWAYDPFVNNVDERIRARMVAIAGFADDKEKYSEKRVLNAFYALVDNDKSLEKRSEDILFNGALMTSLADLTAISTLFLVGTLIAALCGVDTGRAVVLLCGLFTVSNLMQWAAECKHVELGTSQLDYIDEQLKSEAIKKMTLLNA